MSETLKISGKRFELEATKGWCFERRPGGWLIATSPSGARKRFALHELRGRLSFSLDGRLYFGAVEKAGRGSAGGAAAGNDSDLVAQFPGKVRKLLVGEGAQVAAGDPLILIEAMKMEFTVKAPFAGRVTRVLVQEGQQLSPGDRFFEVEPEKGENNG
ncbi:MAG: acetyl-CoA carboxylase biotin carboxyl carrier protein subunit [Oligoflexia bacterium]|nr:acetyl-CoA carboxylase biotin carboxyl carrier protein subunit [Oligoflexia bacterium]